MASSSRRDGSHRSMMLSALIDWSVSSSETAYRATSISSPTETDWWAGRHSRLTAALAGDHNATANTKAKNRAIRRPRESSIPSPPNHRIFGGCGVWKDRVGPAQQTGRPLRASIPRRPTSREWGVAPVHNADTNVPTSFSAKRMLLQPSCDTWPSRTLPTRIQAAEPEASAGANGKSSRPRDDLRPSTPLTSA